MSRWLLILIFVVVGWLTLSYLTGVLGPILAALGMAYLSNPVLELLVRRGVSRTLGAALLLVTFLGDHRSPRSRCSRRRSRTRPASSSPTCRGWSTTSPRGRTTRFGIELPPEWQDAVKSEHLRQDTSARPRAR